MWKTSISLAVISTIQLFIGLFIHLYIVKILSVGMFTDVFIAAQTIPMILSAIFISVFQSVYLPSLSIKAKYPKRWFLEISNLQSRIFVLFLIASCVILILLDYLLGFFFSGFTVEQLSITKTLVVFLLLASWLSTHNIMFSIALRTINKFVQADIIILVGGIINIIIIYYYLSVENIYVLGISYLSSNIIVFIILYFMSNRPVFLVKNIFKNDNKVQMMIPLLKGNILYKTSPLLDRYWLSSASSGVMTLYNIANLIMSSISKIADKLLVVTYLPTIAKLVQAKKMQELKKIYKHLIIKIFIFTLLYIFVLILVQPYWFGMIHYLFDISDDFATLLWWLVLLLSGVFFASLLGTIVNNIFYSFGDSTTPTKIGVNGFLLSIPLKSLGYIYGGVIGLALTTSLYYLGNLLVLMIKLKGKMHE